MRVVVTGGAGFIGSNMVDALVARGDDVCVLDDFSTGDASFLDAARSGDRGHAVDVIELDLLTAGGAIARYVEGADAVLHLAANADVRFGWEAPRRDLEQNVIVTHNVLEAVRAAGVPQILFSSTGSVYGEARRRPDTGRRRVPGADVALRRVEVRGRGLHRRLRRGHSLSATVFRFVSILGPRYTHGHVIDFVRQLRDHPDHLVVLGDGTQRKSYLDVRTASPPSSRASGRQTGSRSSTSASTTTAPSATPSAGSPGAWALIPSCASRAAIAAGSATTRSSTSTRPHPRNRLGTGARHPGGGGAHGRPPARHPGLLDREEPRT